MQEFLNMHTNLHMYVYNIYVSTAFVLYSHTNQHVYMQITTVQAKLISINSEVRIHLGKGY